MKRLTLFLLTSLFMLSMLLIPQSQAAAKGARSISFLGIEFITFKGMVFKFRVEGKFDSFKGSVTLKGKNMPLNCKMTDDGKTLACTALLVKQYVGKTVCGQVNGFSFCGQVPKPNYCYSVFDWAFTPPPHFWVEAGRQCQDHEAYVGETIYWYNPAWSDWYWYVYSLDGSDSTHTPPNLGRGFYWTW
jgi:hypothetical protein